MRVWTLALGGMWMVWALGCGAPRQIQTAPPRPAASIAGGATEATQSAALRLVLGTGATPLPEAVQALRFRIHEVHLRDTSGTWTVYPADVNSFEVRAGERPRRPVLATRIRPAAYDSIAVVFRDLFVLYDANAGGPLTLPREAPLRMGLPFEAAVARPTLLRLTFEPGASLTHRPHAQDAVCRWFFLPFLTAEAE